MQWAIGRGSMVRCVGGSVGRSHDAPFTLWRTVIHFISFGLSPGHCWGAMENDSLWLASEASLASRIFFRLLAYKLFIRTYSCLFEFVGVYLQLGIGRISQESATRICFGRETQDISKPWPTNLYRSAHTHTHSSRRTKQIFIQGQRILVCCTWFKLGSVVIGL